MPSAPLREVFVTETEISIFNEKALYHKKTQKTKSVWDGGEKNWAGWICQLCH